MVFSLLSLFLPSREDSRISRWRYRKGISTKSGRESRQLSKRRLLVSTSNDDLPALAFYQKLGFQIFEVKPNVIAGKHGQLLAGTGGIPIRDEIRLSKNFD